MIWLGIQGEYLTEKEKKKNWALTLEVGENGQGHWINLKQLKICKNS